MTDLRKIAEAAKGLIGSTPWRDYYETFVPDTVLALLNELQSTKNDVDAWKIVLQQRTDECDALMAEVERLRCHGTGQQTGYCTRCNAAYWPCCEEHRCL